MKLDDAHYKDLYYRDNRLLHYTRLLSELRYPLTEKIGGWKHCSGDFTGPEIPGYDLSSWQDFGEFDRFGGKESYGWFCAEVTVPESFRGHYTVLNIKSSADGNDDPFTRWNSANPGFLCYINGKLAGHYDRFHKSIVLTEKAGGGEKFYVALKYWTEFERKDYFCPILRAVDRDVQDLYYDFRVVWEWEEGQNWQDGRRIEMLAPASEAISLIDMRNPGSEEFRASVRAAHEYIWEKGFNGRWKDDAQNAKIICIGHSHIDVAWLWRMHQTREKTRRTFVNALKYIETDPDFTFFNSQPAVYNFVKEDDPELYARVKKAVASGRWEADGGMWVEADCNLTSGEGFVRQFLYGTRFFREEFGRECKMLWLPDVFGYSAALPQILRGFGLSYFTTAKINNSEYNCMPHDTFVWRGIDGSEVFTHLISGARCSNVLRGEFGTSYNTELAPDFLNGTWKHYHDKELTDEIFLPVGWGDGGGGPADYMLEFGKRMSAGLPASVKSEWGHVGDWFDKWSEKLEGNRFLPVWDGELYFELHRGTLTSMARMKKKNRFSEFLYQKAEWLSVLANLLTGTEFPKEKIDCGWRMLLTNQFHDILPGSSYKAVYEDADADYEKVFAIGNEISENAAAAVVSAVNGKAGDIVVFNPSGFDRSDSVCVDCDAVGIAGEKSQRTYDGKLCFTAHVPAKGWAVFSAAGEASGEKTADISGNVVETPFWRITLGEDGAFDSVFDKLARRESVCGKANRLKAYEDLPLSNDAWDINVFYKEKSYETELISSEIIENGPVRAVLRQVRRFNKSVITQNIVFYADSPRIDFVTAADWKERHILLKAHFPIAVNADTATYDIQFGSITRPTHSNTPWDFAKFEVCGHKWADISETGYGAAVLNNCKYGYGASGSDLSLSLIRCAESPNVDADRELHEFTYSFLPHSGNLGESSVIREGYLLNIPLEACVKKNDGGILPKNFSLVSESTGNAVIEAVKPAEDGDGTIIRIYEPRGRRTCARLVFGENAVSVEKTDLAEMHPEKLESDGSAAELPLRAFEIATLRVRWAK